MKATGKASTLLGALVIGGGMLLPGCAVKASDPSEQAEPAVGEPAAETPPAALSPAPGLTLAAPASPLCQIEFGLNRYNRDGILESAERSCLDEKSDEEILTIIKEARKQTCETPFCGCWLG